VNPERVVADAEVVPPKQRSVSSSTESTEETNRPYIEEDDHVVIKSVTDRPKKEISEVAIDLVEPNPDQPRTHFKPEEIEELAASIKKEGLLQPILVRKVGSKYQIIAGERRWQACKSLGSTMIPVRFWKADDDKVLELALIENVQRSDLNPIEEAYGYKRLMERKKMTQSELAIAVSKGRSTIANALRLLDLPEDAQQMLFEEKITAGHARAILSVPTQEGRNKLTKKLSEEKLSVRETEALARLFAGKSKATDSLKKRQPLPDVFKKAAKELRQSLQTNVRIKTVKGKNKIEIEFKDEEELQRLFESMTNSQAE
jgi:ParB family chromosome partitioning protein